METVLCISRSDQQDGSVLLRITRVHADTLDCEIMGTDGNMAFETRLDGARISQFKTTKFEGTEADWTGILQWTLFRQGSPRANGPAIELVAQVTESTLSLIFRQRLDGGITSRLGSIQLRRSTRLEDEIELFEWAGLAANSAHSAQDDVDTLKSQLEQRTRECERLKDQLQDLVEAKKEHEQIMLEKFRQLLNSKKIKIRDQQRLLAGAKMDTNAMTKLANAAGTQARAFQPLTSRSAKRKAADGDMDVDHAKGDTEEDDVEAITSQSNDSGSEDDHFQDPKQGNASVPSPPRRQLPFAAGPSNTHQPAQLSTKQVLDLDGETDDDEL